MTDRTIRDQLAELIFAIQYDDLPQDVIHQAKILILDSLACAYGGYRSRPTGIVLKTIDQLGGKPESTVIGTGEKTSCALATLANGTMIRYLNANDYYFGRDGSHASGNLAPALALCERQGLGGKDLILAMVIAYETQLRFCDSAGEPNIWDRGWHNGTNMQFSSAALSARLLGLDARGIANAIAIGGSHNNTLAQLQRGNIPMMKATAEATVAKGGLEAALLAANGLTGPEEIFEGKVGWARAVAGKVDFDSLTRPINGHYRIMDTCTKPYAAEAMTQAAIQAAIEIVRDNGVDIAEIDSVEARFHDYAFKKPSWDPKKLVPKDRETADHSFPYMIAVAMIEGDCSEAQFRDEMLFSPIVRDLMGRIELAVDPELTALWPYSSGAAIKLKTRTGDIFEKVCAYPPGHPRNRESDTQIIQKFHRMSEEVLAKDQADAIVSAILKLNTFDRVSSLTDLLGVRPS